MIRAEKANYPIRMMCEVLRVGRSGYYAWERRPRSRRAEEDEELVEEIREIHIRSRGTYGSPRVHVALRDRGTRTGRKRIARLMREHEIRARRRRRYQRTTDSEHGLAVAENVLDRQFSVDEPDKTWATDITCVWTDEGWLYLAVILDLYSRRVIGWSMDSSMATKLVLAALEMALGQREMKPGLVHHSDRGSQYASAAYQKRLNQAGMICSMSRKGNCWDSAVVESYLGTLCVELEIHCGWHTRRAARVAIHEYIEVFYNRRRRHSYLGYVSPVEYERRAKAPLADAA